MFKKDVRDPDSKSKNPLDKRGSLPPVVFVPFFGLVGLGADGLSFSGLMARKKPQKPWTATTPHPASPCDRRRDGQPSFHQLQPDHLAFPLVRRLRRHQAAG